MLLRAVGVILALAGIVGCDALKIAKDTKNLVAQSDRRLADIEHKTAIMELKRDLFAPENTEILVPVPFKMMPYGKKLAENLTAQEAVQFALLMMAEVREDQDLGARSEAVFDHQKQVNLTALKVVSGFLPLTTMQEIIGRYIVSPSEYLESASAILVFRARFINDILIGNKILDKKIDSSGMIQAGIENGENLERISRLPYIGSIKMEFKSFALPEHNETVAYHPSETALMWTNLSRKADKYIENLDANKSEEVSEKQKVAREKSIMVGLKNQLRRHLGAK